MTLPYVPAAEPDPRVRFKVPPNLLVVHAIESPIRAGFARLLAGPNYFGRAPADGGPGTSVHWLADPAEVVEGVHPTDIAYHVGPAGNPKTVGQEHTGYTAYTREQWTTPDGLAMIRVGAQHLASVARERGIPWRWLSVVQVARAAQTGRMADGGLCTHNDIRLALGGTTHTDPGPNFPYAEYLAYGLEVYSPATLTEDDMQPHAIQIAHTDPQKWAYVLPDGTVVGDLADTPAELGAFRAVYEGRLANTTQVKNVQQAVAAARKAAGQ